MRPMTATARAILKTANAFSEAGRRATLSELAAGAQVGQQAARHTVSNLKRSGHLAMVGERRVDYRNRPVAEYAPVAPAEFAAPAKADEEPEPQAHWLDLSDCMTAWAR